MSAEATFAVLRIPGAAADITTRRSFWKGYTFEIEGQKLSPHGFPRNRLSIPGTYGPIEARIKGGFLRAYPSLVVGDTEYPTGPATPRGLQILAVLPLLTLLVVQGALGFLFAFGGTAINMGVIRGSRVTSAKVALMVATFVGALVVDVLVVLALA